MTDYLGTVLAELRAARERIAEYENAINWGTSCTSCARALDASIADDERAERAEAELRAAVAANPPGDLRPAVCPGDGVHAWSGSRLRTTESEKRAVHVCDACGTKWRETTPAEKAGAK